MNIQQTTQLLINNGKEVECLGNGRYLVDGKELNMRSLVFAAKMIKAKERKDKSKEKTETPTIEINENVRYRKGR